MFYDFLEATYPKSADEIVLVGSIIICLIVVVVTFYNSSKINLAKNDTSIVVPVADAGIALFVAAICIAVIMGIDAGIKNLYDIQFPFLLTIIGIAIVVSMFVIARIIAVKKTSKP